MSFLQVKDIPKQAVVFTTGKNTTDRVSSKAHWMSLNVKETITDWRFIIRLADGCEI